MVQLWPSTWLPVQLVDPSFNYCFTIFKLAIIVQPSESRCVMGEMGDNSCVRTCICASQY